MPSAGPGPLIHEMQSRANELRKSDITVNCLTYLLPLQNALADRQTRKILTLRKVSDWPLLCEDLAARAYYEAGYFDHAPPKLNIRSGPRPKKPEALRDLESRITGFSFRALISLDAGFRIGGADAAWPCYLVSEIEELPQPTKHIILPRPLSFYEPPTSSSAMPSLSGHRSKRPRAAASNESLDSRSTEPGNGIDELKREVRSLKQQVAQLQAANANESSNEVLQLRKELKDLRQQLASGHSQKLDLESLEAGYERLLRAAYEEWRQQLNAVEERAATVMDGFSSEISELKSRLDIRDGQQ